MYIDRLVGRIRRSLQYLTHLSRHEWALVASVSTYSVFFSIYLDLKYESYRTGYFDFGQSIQTIWQSSQGYINALALGRPITLVTCLLYRVYPQPVTILAFQSFVIGMGAVPVYFLAKRVLGRGGQSLVFAMVYLIYAPVWGVNLYEYHDLSFSITFLLFAFLFYAEGKIIGYIASLLLSLMSNPFIVIVSLSIAVSIGIDYLSGLRRERLTLRFLVSTLVMTLGFVVYLQIIPVIPHYELSSLSTASYTFSGSTSYVNPFFAISNPLYSVTYAWSLKTLYIIAVLGPVLFLPILSIRRFLPALPWLAVVVMYSPNLGGGVGAVYTFSQWSSFLIPFIFVGAVYGFRRFVERKRLSLSWLTPTRTLAAMILAALLLAVIAGGLSPVSPPQTFSIGDTTVPTDTVGNGLYHGVFPTPVKDRQSLDWFIAQIPANDSVLTQNQIGSKLGERLPSVWVYYQPHYGSVDADAILVDHNLPGLCVSCLNQSLASGNYYLYLSDSSGIYLYFKISVPP